MDVIVQETNTIEEYKRVKRNLEEQAVACWKIHKKACEEWGHGEPLKVERDKSGILCVTYGDGAWFHYQITEDGLKWW